MEKIKWVKKRDGRIVPFEKGKITEAIFKAAKSVGGENRYLAEDLAEAVTLYLEKNFQNKTPSVEEIQDIVERVLIKTGHAKTAKAYILYRQKRSNVRKVREGIKPEELIEREKERINLIRDIKISVKRSDDVLTEWDKEKIIETLLRETGISRNIAEIIVSEVEEDVITSKLKVLTSSIIRELVNAKLIQYGFEEERRKHARLGIPVYDISQFFKSFPGTPDEISLKFGMHIKREYALSEVFSSDVVLSHFKGEIFLHCLGEIDKFFSVETYSGLKEEDMNLLDNYCCFVVLKSDVPTDSEKFIKEKKEIEKSKNTHISFDLPLSEGKEILFKIIEKRPVEIELSKEKEREKLIIQKITLNLEKVEDKERITDVIKKGFEEKEVFIDKILKEDIKNFFKKFERKFELEVTGEDEEVFKKIVSFDGNVKINFKTEIEKFQRYFHFLENSNIKVKSRIEKGKEKLLEEIGDNFIVRVNLYD